MFADDQVQYYLLLLVRLEEVAGEQRGCKVLNVRSMYEKQEVNKINSIGWQFGMLNEINKNGHIGHIDFIHIYLAWKKQKKQSTLPPVVDLLTYYNITVVCQNKS